jgi:hypothetical protein
VLRVVGVLQLAVVRQAARRVVVLLPQVVTVPRAVAEVVVAEEAVGAVDEDRQHRLCSTG